MNSFQDTHIGIIPIDASIKPLGDCISNILDYRGKTPKKLGSDWVEKGIPAISAKNIHNGELDNRDSIRHVTFKVYKEWMKEDVKKGDCFLVSEGATLGEVLYWDYDYPIVLSQRLFCIRTNPDILYSKYFYAYMNTFNFQMQVKGKATGSSVDGLRQSAVLQLEIPIIPMKHQKFIGDFLYNLDKKKKLLQAQNKTLEAIAQTIFAEWFGKYQVGEELPEGWRVGKLGDVTKTFGGTTPSTKNRDFWDGNIHWTSPKDLSISKSMFLLRTEKKITEEGLKKISSGLLPKRTLLLSSRAPVGYLSLTNIELAINQGYIALMPNQYFSNNYMYLWLDRNMQKIINAANGSTFLEISKSSFRNIDCIIPEEKILKKFNDFTNPIFGKILSNLLQIQTLTQTRDTLLPKLMSGALRVQEIKKAAT